MSDKPVVINMRGKPGTADYFTRVDRGTEWGNPFMMRHEGERERVCQLFELYAEWRLTVDPHWLEPLRGKHLGCWCAPKRCHAETLLRMANEVGEAMSERRILESKPFVSGGTP